MPWPVHVLMAVLTGGIWFVIWVAYKMISGSKNKNTD